MAYVGTPIDTTNQFQSLQGKRFSGDASTTAFTLDIAPSSVFDIEVFVENVRQDPNSAYSLSGTTLTFAAAPPSGTNNIYVVHQAKAVGTIDVPASGVVPASLASNIISGQTELAVPPATTDELLISDAGTIKRIDFSLLGNAPAFQAKVGSNQTLSDDSFTKIQFNTEEYDTNSAYDNSSNYRFTVPSNFGGKYFVYVVLVLDSDANSNLDTSNMTIYKNGSAHSNGGIEFYMHSNPPRFVPLVFSVVMDLSASDYIEVYGRIEANDASGGRALANSTFGAYKLIGI